MGEEAFSRFRWILLLRTIWVLVEHCDWKVLWTHVWGVEVCSMRNSFLFCLWFFFKIKRYEIGNKLRVLWGVRSFLASSIGNLFSLNLGLPLGCFQLANFRCFMFLWKRSLFVLLEICNFFFFFFWVSWGCRKCKLKKNLQIAYHIAYKFLHLFLLHFFERYFFYESTFVDSID